MTVKTFFNPKFCKQRSDQYFCAARYMKSTKNYPILQTSSNLNCKPTAFISQRESFNLKNMKNVSTFHRQNKDKRKHE